MFLKIRNSLIGQNHYIYGLSELISRYQGNPFIVICSQIEYQSINQYQRVVRVILPGSITVLSKSYYFSLQQLHNQLSHCTLSYFGHVQNYL